MSLIVEEVEAAVKRQKCHKSTGADDVAIEMILVTGETGIEIIHKIYQEIWDTGIWPEDCATSIYIPLQKVPKIFATRELPHHRPAITFQQDYASDNPCV